MNSFKEMIPILICDDVQQSLRFYTEVLGFSVVDRMDDIGKTGWASLRQGQVALMLGSPDYIPEPRKSQGRYSQAMFYFYPDDIAQLHATLCDHGQTPTDLTDRFYGMREFEMLDPSGHVLVFGQEIGQ